MERKHTEHLLKETLHLLRVIPQGGDGLEEVEEMVVQDSDERKQQVENWYTFLCALLDEYGPSYDGFSPHNIVIRFARGDELD